MTQHRLRFYAPLAACALVSGVIGFLLALHLTPAQFATVAVLWAVAGALAWWKWGAGDKREDIKRWLGYRWRRFKRLPLGILGVLFGMAVVSCVVGFWGEGWKGLWQSLGPELGGAVVTYVLLDLVLGTRQRKEDLIVRMGSDVRHVAVAAVRELRDEEWLMDGSLRGGKFGRANLVKAPMKDADLRDANLSHAQLSGAKLVSAKLTNAVLWNADLQNTAMDGADLRGALLWKADLTGTTLMWADLTGAEVTPEQLALAIDLCGATLRDGSTLSEDNWQVDFKEWRNKQEAEAEGDGDDDNDGDDWGDDDDD